jgi:hypothetical protein
MIDPLKELPEDVIAEYVRQWQEIVNTTGSDALHVVIYQALRLVDEIKRLRRVPAPAKVFVLYDTPDAEDNSQVIGIFSTEEKATAEMLQRECQIGVDIIKFELDRVLR